MKEEFLDRIASGLRRKGITKCSKWAEEYRVLKDKKWSFLEFPWLRELHDCEAEFVIGQKAAQIGFTEFALNRTFYKIDVVHTDCLYVLPTESDASDFSSGRFDPALAESEHLAKLFSDVNNVGLKRAGNSTLYVRGSKSRSKLKSIPTGHITLDEVEEMAQENIPLAFERASGQHAPQKILISTPIVPKHGINSYFLDSTQDHFYFKCPSCSKYIILKFPESLVITGNHINDPDLNNSHYICYECKATLPHELKVEYLNTGKYVSLFPGRDMHGYTCNQMYSMRPAGEPKKIAISYLKSLDDPTEEQEFFNSKLGQPRIVSDSQLSEQQIEDCKKPYAKGKLPKSRLITIGFDVGKVWHYEVNEWFLNAGSKEVLINERAVCRVLDYDTIDVKRYGEEAILDVIRKWKATGVVIDKQPETVTAYNIAMKFFGVVYLCSFIRGAKAKRLQFNDQERTVSVDRTSWLDLSFKRFRNRTIQIPANVSQEYIQHMLKPIRVYEKDADGNPVGRYVSTDDKDHFAFARVYAEIALGIASRNRRPRDITSAV